MTEENRQLLEILRSSLWENDKSGGEIPDSIRAELQAQTVEGLTAIAYSDTQNLKYEQTARFVSMAHMQTEAIERLRSAGIPVVVLKGMAAGIYYPRPQLRTYGDIDLLVQPERYHDALAALRDGGWRQLGSEESHHTQLKKNNELLELHPCRPGRIADRETRYIYGYLLDGFSDIREGEIEQAQCRFPMLPWRQNGLELIWHFRVHLYNGIGLRHVVDWMMFVDRCLDDRAIAAFKPVLEEAGLLRLAKAVTRLCQLYLGLREEDITWCADADASICAALMDFILEQGNFGYKRPEDKAAKVMTRYRRPLEFLIGMQRKGLREWPAVRKHPYLRPLAWAYVGVRSAKTLLTPAGRAALRQARAESNRRNGIFDQLFGEKSK